MFDFSGIDPNTIGDGVSIDLPTGVYKGKVASCTPSVASTGRAQFEFKLQCTEAPYAGAVRTEWISVPTGPEDSVLFIWARAFQSIGVAPAKLKQVGKIPEEKIPAFFTNKECYFSYTKGDRDMGERDKTKFLTANGYKAMQAAAAAAPAPAPVHAAPAPVHAAPVTPVTVVTAPAPAPAPAAVPVQSGVDDLMAALSM